MNWAIFQHNGNITKSICLEFKVFFHHGGLEHHWYNIDSFKRFIMSTLPRNGFFLVQSALLFFVYVFRTKKVTSVRKENETWRVMKTSVHVAHIRLVLCTFLKFCRSEASMSFILFSFIFSFGHITWCPRHHNSALAHSFFLPLHSFLSFFGCCYFKWTDEMDSTAMHYKYPSSFILSSKLTHFFVLCK